jgi:hypothetical protein
MFHRELKSIHHSKLRAIAFYTSFVLARIIMFTCAARSARTFQIHWHGLDQILTISSDGVAGTTQCAILPGDTLTYGFRASQSGTFWYHGHKSEHYMVRDSGPPNNSFQPAKRAGGQLNHDIIGWVCRQNHASVPL